VFLAGEVDVANAAQFGQLVRQQFDRGLNRLDLTGMHLLSSAGVAVLYELAADRSGPGLELLVAEGSVVARVVEVCGLGAVATVRPVPPPPVNRQPTAGS